MTRRTSSIATAGILGLGLLTAPWGSEAGAAPTVTRYAAPNGSGTACTPHSPCDIVRAVNFAPEGAEVIIRSGHYGGQVNPIPDEIIGAQNLKIHGQVGKAMPVIFTSATTGIQLYGSTIDHVSIVHTGSSEALRLTNSGADHVRVQSDQVACDVLTATIYNSVCVSTGSAAVRTYAKYYSLSSTLRNVTAVSSGTSNAVECDASAGGSCSMSLINTAAVALGSGADVAINAFGGGDTSVTAFNSQIDATSQTVDPGSTGFIHTDDSDIVGHPAFVDQSNGNFREAKSSPSIDAGLTGGAESSTDLDGLPRVLGKAADIGAYEFAARPGVHKIRVTKRGKHSIHFTAVLNTRQLPLTVRVIAHHHTSSVTRKPTVVRGSRKPKTVKLVAHQLRAHTKYTIEVKVASAGGTASSTSKGVRTRS